MSATIDYLPVWKKNSTPSEWLQELAAVALKHPERFGQICVVMHETLPTGNVKIRQYNRGAKTTELIGLMVWAQHDLLSETSR